MPKRIPVTVPTAGAARDAADEIVARRTAAKDPHLHELDDSLEGVVAHVASHGGDEAAVVTALRILDHLDAAYARRLALWRLQLIEAGRAAGMGPTALQGPLHQNCRQGVVDLVGRLRARLDYDVPTADSRALRRKLGEEAAARAAAVSQGAGLVVVAQALIARADQLPADLGECGVDTEDLAYFLPEPGAAPRPGLVGSLRTIIKSLAGVDLSADLRGIVDRGAEILAGLPA